MQKILVSVVFWISFLVQDISAQSLADYYRNFNSVDEIIVTHRYHDPDTSYVFYERIDPDILCNCIWEDESLRCLMDLNDEQDDLIISFTSFQSDTASIKFLSAIYFLNSYFKMFHTDLLFMPTQLKVTSVQNYNKIQRGDIIELNEVFYSEHLLSSKCRTDLTGYKHFDPPSDFYINKIKVNEPVTNREKIHALMLDQYNKKIDCAFEANMDLVYPKLEKILVPVDKRGIDRCLVRLINDLKDSNPQANVHLSFKNSIGRAQGEIDPKSFEWLEQIKVPVHVDFQPFHLYELDSVLGFVPPDKIKSLKLIFPGSTAKKAVDLEQFKSIQHFENLVEIYFEGKTKNLPAGIEKLSNLKLLSGAFESIPQNLGHIRSLEALQLIGTYMQTMNDFDNQLSNLKLLQLDYIYNGHIKKIPSSFAKCEQLKVVKFNYWDSLTSFSPFYNLPLEYLILEGATWRSWSFILEENLQMKYLKLLTFNSGEYYDPKKPPFDYIKALYVGRHYQKIYMNNTSLPFIEKLRSQDKLILLDSPDELQIDGVSNSVNELIKLGWQLPLYELKK